MSDQDPDDTPIALPLTLIPIRQLRGNEPVIVVPYPHDWGLHIERIKHCEIYALPDGCGPECFDTFWWMQLWERDVSFWPIDARSGAWFTLILQRAFRTKLEKAVFAACRMVWEKTDEPGEIENVETLWNGAA